MSMDPAELLSAAMRLPKRERADMAARLIRSLDDGADADEDVEAAWAAELDRRMRQLEDGTAGTVPAEDAMAQAWEVVRRAKSR